MPIQKENAINAKYTLPITYVGSQKAETHIIKDKLPPSMGSKPLDHRHIPLVAR